MKPTSEYYYVRTNSKGEKIFRRDTNETLKYVRDFLKSKEIPHRVYRRTRLIRLTFREIIFYYYYTSGRWSPKVFGDLPKVHYYSNGIEDFYTRFLLNQPTPEERENRKKERKEKYNESIKEIKQAVLQFIKDAGEYGTTNRQIIEKFKNEYEADFIGSLPYRLRRENAVFYNYSDTRIPAGGTRHCQIIRHIDFKKSQ